uniref:Oleosin n=1 Tax=Oryza punctata TaxID=4537 RepID=A0A0E0JLP8_ORYPU
MADGPPAGRAALPGPPRSRCGQVHTDVLLRRRIQHHAYDSARLVGFLALAVTLAAVLVLAGVTLTVAFVADIVLSPLLLLTSPLWVPMATAVFVSGAASIIAWCLAVGAVAAGTWAYQYFTGRHRPVSAHRVDYDVDAGTANGWMGYYAREYGARPRVRVKDAAPGA